MKKTSSHRHSRVFFSPLLLIAVIHFHNQVRRAFPLQRRTHWRERVPAAVKFIRPSALREPLVKKGKHSAEERKSSRAHQNQSTARALYYLRGGADANVFAYTLAHQSHGHKYGGGACFHNTIATLCAAREQAGSQWKYFCFTRYSNC